MFAVPHQYNAGLVRDGTHIRGGLVRRNNGENKAAGGRVTRSVCGTRGEAFLRGGAGAVDAVNEIDRVDKIG